MVQIADEELVERFPDQVVDHDTAPHFRGRLDRRLLIQRCGACGTWQQPPTPICPACWSTEMVPTEVRGTGTIYLVVFLYQGPLAVGVDYSTPYPVVTVELDEQVGLRFTSAVVGADNDRIAIGGRVVLDWIDRNGTPLPVFCLEGSTG